ncbi:hypothetical protein BDW22DRAFT_944563 [Trametopsis cervina]|nr:hypothetical protein BDW22DRAFT_944563 [Trametopsis cervina]
MRWESGMVVLMGGITSLKLSVSVYLSSLKPLYDERCTISPSSPRLDLRWCFFFFSGVALAVSTSRPRSLDVDLDLERARGERKARATGDVGFERDMSSGGEMERPVDAGALAGIESAVECEGEAAGVDLSDDVCLFCFTNGSGQIAHDWSVDRVQSDE